MGRGFGEITKEENLGHRIGFALCSEFKQLSDKNTGGPYKFGERLADSSVHVSHKHPNVWEFQRRQKPTAS